ncbi:uncharacterized protein Bfra_005166 [Botrytis fragariae]|uniref:Uncharacterized protein n=1 Tax=Botrytis fragariae TaxID=1964551 RepID=A0A8H6AU95_9HELO|nr:uncharacterized protein Bfra_005166 [Botrytis fragariae]KAF5873702.1 hypothetical protein Bfra_005166 [Botrytis fragariae]
MIWQGFKVILSNDLVSTSDFESVRIAVVLYPPTPNSQLQDQILLATNIATIYLFTNCAQ